MKAACLAELDACLPHLTSKIRVVEALAWPDEVMPVFLAGWRKGAAQLPDVELRPRADSAAITALDDFTSRCDMSHPAGRYLALTASSYATAGRMLGAIGKADFTRYSAMLYQRPDFRYPGQDVSTLDMARFLLKTTEALLATPEVPTDPAQIPAEDFVAWMQPELDRFFGPGQIQVTLDSTMAAKALAGVKRIKVRADAVFTERDKKQLLQHEALVHVATAQNGRLQPNLKSMGLGAPRTTQTQEGIAALAELMTASMDLKRLRRLALRVVAVQQALEGADFIQVFEGLLEAGQSEEESFLATQRVFRGAALCGGAAFTKDCAYLNGLVGVHTLLRMAIRDNRPELLRQLFAGRLSLPDLVYLAPLFESGWLKGPVHLPPWAADISALAANLSLFASMSEIKLDAVDLNDFINYPENVDI